MSYTMSLKLQPKQTQNLKQNQLLMMLPQMQQAITLLQIPVQEMMQIIEQEMERNPILELSEDANTQEERNEALSKELSEENMDIDTPVEKEMSFNDRDFDVLKQLDEDFRDHFAQSEDYTPRTMEDEKRKVFLENSIPAPRTLFSHLMEQAKQTFDDQEDLEVAEEIIGNIDDKGYLQVSLEEISALTGYRVDRISNLLSQIQTFEPYGVGATTVQECLLIQLRCLEKQKTLAYQIIEKHYDDLLHNRIPLIQKKLGCSHQDVRHAIDQQIAKLDLHPGAWYSQPASIQIMPDVTVRQEDDKLIVEINDEPIPTLRLNARYLRMLDDETVPQETKEFIKQSVISAKWLVRNISQRNETLVRIVQYLTQIQKEFFIEPDGKLVPLTMREVAEELKLHESTIARAVANKYINSPRGLILLRSFFTNAYTTNQGKDISSQTVREALQKIIEEENKKHPFSDETISKKLKEQGINCARRTVAKYRREFHIGNALQRKKYE